MCKISKLRLQRLTTHTGSKHNPSLTRLGQRLRLRLSWLRRSVLMMRMKYLVWLCCLGIGCKEVQAPLESAEEPATDEQQNGLVDPEKKVSVSPKGALSPKVELASEPSIDLVARRHLFHYAQDGWIINLAGEGLRKFTQEYKRPWKGIVTVDGQKGRVLSSRAATLRFPWFDDEPATRVSVFANGLVDGQKITLRLGSKVLGNKTLSKGWNVYDFNVTKGLIGRGEHELQIHVSKKSTIKNTSSYGLFHSIEVGGGSRSDKYKTIQPAFG